MMPGPQNVPICECDDESSPRSRVEISIVPFRNRRGRVTGYTARCEAFTTTAKTPEEAERQLKGLLGIASDSLT